MLHWNKVISWPKGRSFFNMKSLITKVGKEGMGAQSTAYKSEIDVMIDQKDRTDDSYVYAARMKLQLEKYWLVPK
jgi:hypothetical protein